MEETKIIEANLDLTLHSQAVLELSNLYAADPMGNGQSLSPEVAKELIPGLSEHPTTIIFLAFKENKAVGIATCFKEFSTFHAKAMIHISDFYLIPEFRGQKIGKMLLEAVHKKANDLNCCKIILEVQENNQRAMQIYRHAGFSRQVHVKEAGGAILFSQTLSEEN